MNANIMKTHIFYKMKYDLQGHQRSHWVILKFQRGSLAHNPSPSLTLSLCLSFCSLSLVVLLSFSFPPNLPLQSTSTSYPPYASLSFLSPSFSSLFFNLNLRSYGQLLGHQRSHRVILKFQRGSLAQCPSPPLSFSYSLSMPLYLFSLSCSSYLFLFSTPPSSYICFISSLCFFIFSLSLLLLLIIQKVLIS